MFGKEQVKDHQQEAIVSFLKGQDIFIQAPTGYWKSLIFQAAFYTLNPLNHFESRRPFGGERYGFTNYKYYAFS